MKYALNLAEDGRILSVTYEEYAPEDAVIVEEIPEDNVANYRYVEGEFVHDPIPHEEEQNEPTVNEILDALLGVTE